MSAKRAAEIRAELGHPVLDADGHVLELLPAVYPFLREELGAAGFERYLAQGPPMRRKLEKRSVAEMSRDRSPQMAWWGAVSENTVDRATFMFPRLLCERMEEVGMDFAVLYTTHGLSSCAIPDEDLRLGTLRAFNRYYAEIYGPHRDRLTVAGAIPMHTPEEAIAELRHCHELGIRAVGFPEGVLRPTEAGASRHPQLWPGQAHWHDVYGLDSLYDYDPVWTVAEELGFAVSFHGSLGMAPGVTSSPSSYVYNHVGMFADLVKPVCKALFLGGVTRRFPGLAFAFLECGVSWAVQMLCDLVEHWERRNTEALGALDPAKLDVPELARYFERYGDGLRARLEGDFEDAVLGMPIDDGKAEAHDEFEALGAGSPEELAELFARGFFFGCEAGDRGIATAFPPFPPRGQRLNAIFSSDMGHWDVTDVTGVLPEAMGLVEAGLLSTEDFRRFAFENPAQLFTRANPGFFEGTVVEESVREVLQRSR